MSEPREYSEELVGKIADIVEEFAPDGPPGIRQMWAYGIGERILHAIDYREAGQ